MKPDEKPQFLLKRLIDSEDFKEWLLITISEDQIRSLDRKLCRDLTWRYLNEISRGSRSVRIKFYDLFPTFLSMSERDKTAFLTRHHIDDRVLSILTQENRILLAGTNLAHRSFI